jgi:hypothetical protein
LVILNRYTFSALLLLLSLARSAHSQQTELIVRGGIDLANFLGAGDTNDLTVKGDFYASDNTPAAYKIDPFLRNPYSRRIGVGTSLGLRVQRVRSQGGIIALEVGVDQAVSGQRVAVFDGTPQQWLGPYQLTESATGRAGLTRWVVPVFVGVGHRWRAGSKGHLDVLVGPEFGWVVAAHEKGHGTHSGRYTPTDTPWEVNLPRHLHHHLDWRVRADATFWVDRLGLNANYSWGLTNLQTELKDLPQFYVPAPVHTQLLRVGVAYRLR